MSGHEQAILGTIGPAVSRTDFPSPNVVPPVCDADSDVPLPSQGVRTIVTLLLFVHLSALAIAVLVNFGTYRSALRNQLGEVPGIRSYLHGMHMDTAYNYQFVLGLQEDWDHTCEILLETPEGFQGQADEIAALESLPLIPEGTWLGMRRRRYLMLGLHTALNLGDDGRESLLPTALANGMLHRHGVTDGVHRFRCRNLMPLTMNNMSSADSEQRDPYNPQLYADVYQADLLPSRNGWNPSKVESLGQMTQLRRERTDEKK